MLTGADRVGQGQNALGGIAWRVVPVMAALLLAGCAGGSEGTVARGQYSLRVADAALASGAPDMALRVADIILDKDPANVAALIARGDALYAMGQMTRSRAAYRAAIALDAAAVPAQVGLGRTLIRSDPRAAEAAFSAATTLEPHNTTALNNLGITRDLLGRRDEAQAAYRQALAVAPGMADVKVNLGLSLALSGRTAEASQLMRPLAEHADATPLWRNDVAVALTLAGDRAGARRALDALPVGEGEVRYGPVTQIAQAVPAAQVTPVATTAQVAAIRAAPRVVVARQDIGGLPPASAGVVVATVEQAVPEKAVAGRAVALPAGFQIQLGSLDREANAHALWERLAARLPGLLRERTPAISETDLQGRSFWRLRTGGFASRREAGTFCQRVRAQGQDCWAL